MGFPRGPDFPPLGPEDVGPYSMDMNDRVDQATEDSREWFPGKTFDLVHQMIGLCNEAGELLGWWKKWDRRHNRQLDLLTSQTKADMANELVDVLVYAFNVAACLNIDLEKEYDRKRAFNQSRFGKHQQRSDAVAEGRPRRTE